MDEKIIARIPPNDSQAEQAVLGAMLADKDAVLTVVEILKPADFYKTEHEEIYSAILDLYSKGSAIDLLTVKEQLRLRGKYDVINGFEYLASLTNPMFSVSNVEYYAKIVEEKAILRQLIKASNDITHDSYEALEPASDILEKAEKSVFNIAQKKTEKQCFCNEFFAGRPRKNTAEIEGKLWCFCEFFVAECPVCRPAPRSKRPAPAGWPGRAQEMQ